MPARPVSLSQIPTLASLLKSSSTSQVAERISLYQGDITSLDIDAIVNAANTSLLGGGGVDGAIHRAAGKGLLEECRKLNGCETGDAKITAGYDLPARFVVHTVGPVYKKTKPEESAAKLESAYRRSLEEASQHKSHIRSIAFPSISTGVYGYPMKDATKIALRTVADFLEGREGKEFERVVFCTFSSGDYKVYEELVGEVFGKDRAENM